MLSPLLPPPFLPSQEHREQCVCRVGLLASLCQQHSRTSQGRQDLTFDDSLGRFAVVPVGSAGGSGEGGDSPPAGTGEEEGEGEGEVVDLDESFGFSDSDSEAVIEMTSSEEEGEGEESAVSRLKSQVSELRLDDPESGEKLPTESEKDLAIEQLKVCWYASVVWL